MSIKDRIESVYVITSIKINDEFYNKYYQNFHRNSLRQVEAVDVAKWWQNLL